ncbi:MAG: VOC family protein [Acidimicrobiales bacterium]
MERDSYASGSPCWVDLASPDIEASIAFYSSLLGWEVAEPHPDAGGYRIAHLRGKSVAGVGPQQGPVPAWTTYFATVDAEAHAAAITAHGGTVMMGPMDVMDQGRMVIATDPEGAVFGLWQAQSFPGAQLYAETGAFGWNELWTRDREKAKAFYPKVFGSEADDEAMPGYTIWKIDGQMAGGAMTIPADMPPQVPAHWAVYFNVDDTDTSAARVTELGGSVVAPPFNVEGVGRIALVHGPAHESFGLFSAL